MKKLLMLLVLTPIIALAHEGGGSAPNPAPEPRGWSPEAAQRMQKRTQLALTLGLAEALDLNEAQALKVRDQLEKLSPRRQAAYKQLRESVQVLRRSAKGEKVAAPEVDQALTRLLEARDQLQALDRELVTTVTRDQPPDKRARAVLFLARFQQHALQRAGSAARRGMGRGPMGPGMGPGRGARGDGPLGMVDEGAWADSDDLQ
jgi:hypothetical protein